ncbi:MAG: ATP-binding protein [Spirochaetes bacterium GWF1_51_8]|nr:MAG: ATP-binding protein [Spirochaetes bacterium GWF1_51_8]
MSIDNILIAKSQREIRMIPKMSNRHGYITGATGTGKTVTLQVLAENFSRLGVPVFLADVKGDLSGISAPGGGNPRVDERVKQLGLPPVAFKGCPVAFWDIFGEKGHRIRTTISELGPMLLSRLLDLNDVQSGNISLMFKVADENGLLLLDMKDLRSVLNFLVDNAGEISTAYGKVSAQSIQSIQRNLLTLEEQGAEMLFGEPALDLGDMMRVDAQGYGLVNILSADRLIMAPKVYSTFLLWMLSELFEQLPEVGDLEKPKMVFFFDEAHLLFTDAPKALLQKIEQVVRLIRSKGVGVYFITQSPGDVPESVLGQLSNRVQHALRAYTPKDQKDVKAAAETFRANKGVNVEEAITQMGVGEALVSFLGADGVPEPVERAFICPPRSHIGPIEPSKRAELMSMSGLQGKYDTDVDRESAYEVLTKRHQQTQAQAQQEQAPGRQQQAQRFNDAPAYKQPKIKGNQAGGIANILGGLGALGGLAGLGGMAGASSSKSANTSLVRGIMGLFMK